MRIYLNISSRFQNELGYEVKKAHKDSSCLMAGLTNSLIYKAHLRFSLQKSGKFGFTKVHTPYFQQRIEARAPKYGLIGYIGTSSLTLPHMGRAQSAPSFFLSQIISCYALLK